MRERGTFPLFFFLRGGFCMRGRQVRLYDCVGEMLSLRIQRSGSVKNRDIRYTP